nr:MAG TPA: hypothetical protein [Caudoviricetes sp.]
MSIYEKKQQCNKTLDLCKLPTYTCSINQRDANMRQGKGENHGTAS